MITTNQITRELHNEEHVTAVSLLKQEIFKHLKVTGEFLKFPNRSFLSIYDKQGNKSKTYRLSTIKRQGDSILIGYAEVSEEPKFRWRNIDKFTLHQIKTMLSSIQKSLTEHMVQPSLRYLITNKVHLVLLNSLTNHITQLLSVKGIDEEGTKYLQITRDNKLQVSFKDSTKETEIQSISLVNDNPIIHLKSATTESGFSFKVKLKVFSIKELYALASILDINFSSDNHE